MLPLTDCKDSRESTWRSTDNTETNRFTFEDEREVDDNSGGMKLARSFKPNIVTPSGPPVDASNVLLRVRARRPEKAVKAIRRVVTMKS
jgi:hypothetical protein